MNLGPILVKRLRIQGSTLRARDVGYKARLVQEFRDVLPHVTGSEGDGKLRVYIHKVHPWNEIIEATREMEANKNSYANYSNTLSCRSLKNPLIAGR